MKFDGKMLLDAGLSAGPIIGKLLAILNQDSYTVNGMNQIVQGFLNHKLPKHVETSRGDTVPNLNLMKLFYDFEEEHKVETFQLLKASLPYNVFGAENIEKGAIDQMNNAMRLPVAVAGAVMPDSHQGYALPIGGVLATDNVVIPNAVGVDISCSMKLSVFGAENAFPSRNSLFKQEMRKALKEQTVFGTGIKDLSGLVRYDGDMSVLESDLWNDIPLLKRFNMRNVAMQQLGTSGSGNHFVDFGDFFYTEGPYIRLLGLLSHSGSRGLGYKIAKLYHDLAVKRFQNKEFHGFAWLDMDNDEGREYWAAMHLCADFARTCHEMIHARICRVLKLTPIDTAFTNHNFAWREQHFVNGKVRDVIVHRKGAVRAFAGETGIIGGSMGTSSFLVDGRGSEASLCSCSHGSGRLMSRSQAKQTFNASQMKAFMLNAGVELLEGGLDECPMAYKDVKGVMDAQKDLVTVLGEFKPKMVIMGEEEDEKW